jgi:hypothetical protein
MAIGVKRSGRESDHLPPSSAEVKNTWLSTGKGANPLSSFRYERGADMLLYWRQTISPSQYNSSEHTQLGATELSVSQ